LRNVGTPHRKQAEHLVARWKGGVFVLSAAEGQSRASEGDVLFLAPHSTVMGNLPLQDGRARFQPRRTQLDSSRGFRP
jgi:hypothetical protein